MEGGAPGIGAGEGGPLELWIVVSEKGLSPGSGPDLGVSVSEGGAVVGGGAGGWGGGRGSAGVGPPGQ